ncbi:MAG: exodeoxyribonuclease V subunit gamma [Acidobacteriia bacterium]|nr:exodeoxyribonuclease V subunit gamma [Terriglobia bacterium]
MISPSLIHSCSNQVLLRKASAFLAALPAGPGAVILSATRQAGDELLRQGPGTGFLGMHRFTLPQLAASLAAKRAGERNLAPLSHLGMEALAARVVHSATGRKALDYFAPVAAMPGFARALAATILELRMEQVDPEDLVQTGAPGQDLAVLLTAYEEEMRERSLADLPLLLQLASEESSSHPLLGRPLLLLDVPVRALLHRQLIARLAAQSPLVLATVLSGDSETIAALEQVLSTTAVAADEFAESTCLAHTRPQLFAPQLASAAPVDDTLQMFSAPGESLECVEIARRIHAAAASGVAFDQIAILLRNPERYQPLIEEALRRADVPGYFSHGTLRPDPAGRAFLALLLCAAEDCTATRFGEYLSLAQVPDLDAQGAPIRTELGWTATADELLTGFFGAAAAVEPDPEAAASPATPTGWERLLVDAAVVGGHHRWQRRLRGLEAELKLQRAAAQDDDSLLSSLDRRLHQLKALESFALPLIELLSSLPKQASWGDWIERLTVLAETALRRPESVLSMLNELRPMSDVGPAALDEVHGALAGLRFLRRQPPARRYGRVFIGAIEEARARHFQIVFLPGLAEGIFPRRAQEDPLLLDVYRAQLQQPLAVQDDRVMRERLLLLTAAASARQLIVSYSRMDAALSRPRVPSFYALEMVRAAEGRLPDLRAFEKQAEQAAPIRLGWPAPLDESQAIDDAEYDVATLCGAVEAGVARYMVESNAALGRSLRTRFRRWQKKWSAADGIVAPDAATVQALSSSRLSQRSFSPTSLQQFAACPYKFLLYSIFQLREREDSVALEQMDPLTRGQLFHAIQFELFRELKGGSLLPIAPHNTAEVLDRADTVLDRVVAHYREELAPAIDRVWESEVEELRTDLRGWIREVATFDLEWMPVRFEFAFGLPLDAHRDEASSPDEIVIAGARLRGSVDLVERHTKRNLLRITDHKTGKAPGNLPAYVGGGAVLQPVLYSLAVEQLLGEPVESGRLSYCTQRGGYTRAEIRMSPSARLHLGQVLTTIDTSIEKGFLPAAPRKDACKYCEYRPICGPYEEQRVLRKPQEQLESLLELRDLL